MSRNELIAKIETLQTLEALIEETKAEAETVRNSIKAEMEAADTEELSAGYQATDKEPSNHTTRAGTV